MCVVPEAAAAVGRRRRRPRQLLLLLLGRQEVSKQAILRSKQTILRSKQLILMSKPAYLRLALLGRQGEREPQWRCCLDLHALRRRRAQGVPLVAAAAAAEQLCHQLLLTEGAVTEPNIGLLS